MNPFKKIIDAKRAAQGELQSLGKRYIKGESVVDNEANPYSALNRQRNAAKATKTQNKFINSLKAGAKIRLY